MNHCSKCGAELEPSAEPAPCPACLLEAGLSFLPEEPKATVVPITEKPGDRIGRYKLLQPVGEGGCGVVYMAEQTEPVRRRVALKVIKLGMDTKQVIARFEAERQALALMDHPNIAKVLDAGATEAGRPYFVMELVRGIKITEFCDEKSVPTADRLKLFTQVCQAIQHAHQKGVIHRDIKPSNILVTVNDGVPVPKIIDFGIAKATAGPLTDKTFFTAFEQFIGTPAYMSPEQAEMTSLDIDTRTDIYSLGVLLYELLTGRPPFDPSELLQSGLDEMRRTIREKEPDRPSTRLSTMAEGELTTVAKHRHTEAPRLIHLVRGDLDWIVMKCLEKDRARRYETANGLASDIQRHLNDEPVVARPPSTLYRIEKLVRRNRLAFTAAVLVALALVLGIVASTWQAIRATRFRQQAQGEAQRAEAEALANRQNLYAADMNLANHALENYNLPRARHHSRHEVGRELAALALQDLELRAEHFHAAALLQRHRVVAHDPAAIPLHRAHEREGNAGAAAGVFDHRHAGFQVAAALGTLDHRERHAILVGAGGIVVLELHPHVRRSRGNDARQADQRRIPDSA